MWKVVPLCNKQLRDINKNDILHNGYFRKCNTYKSGGGYDKFPKIAEKRLNMNGNNQFVVQLYGCSLSCPYCYVTRDGIYGEYKTFTTNELIDCFIESKQDVFHLMGGSPALYIENWYDIIDKLPKDKIFHSDLLLVEKKYDIDTLKSISKNNCLYAVSIKGYDEEDFYRNTNVKFNKKLFWNNFDVIINVWINFNLEFYLTFINCNKDKKEMFWHKLCIRYGCDIADMILEDSFEIDLIDYDALKE